MKRKKFITTLSLRIQVLTAGLAAAEWKKVVLPISDPMDFSMISLMTKDRRGNQPGTDACLFNLCKFESGLARWFL
jgi:hypothetical protein